MLHGGASKELEGMTMSDPSFLIFPIYAAGLIVLLAGEFYQRRSFFPKKEDAMPIYAFSVVEEAATPEDEEDEETEALREQTPF